MPDDDPSKPMKASGKLRILVGGPPPPRATVFKPSGTIEHAPDTPEARREWAIRKMTSRIEQQPEDGEWYFERAMALVAPGRFAEAIPDFSKLIDLFPKWGNYH